MCVLWDWLQYAPRRTISHHVVTNHEGLFDYRRKQHLGFYCKLSYLRKRATSPLRFWGLTAGLLIRAAEFSSAVTLNIFGLPCSSLLGLRQSQGHSADAQLISFLLTGARLHVAVVALGAAMLMVCTADSLKEGSERDDIRLLDAVSSEDGGTHSNWPCAVLTWHPVVSRYPVVLTSPR